MSVMYMYTIGLSTGGDRVYSALQSIIAVEVSTALISGRNRCGAVMNFMCTFFSHGVRI